MSDPKGATVTAKGGRPAVFLDRDGTINEEADYLIEPNAFRFVPGAPQALRQLQDAGFLLVVVTNQSGVARGYFSEQQVERLHEYMLGLLAEAGVQLQGIYICPHHPTAGQGDYLADCACRKGKPGMLLQAARELGIDLRRSFMVGDKLADVEAGLAAGCQPLLVKTGYGAKYVDRAAELNVPVVDDLAAAAVTILRHPA